jgi:hypothetical protein
MVKSTRWQWLPPVVLVLLLALAAPAHAWTATYTWAPSSGATGYKVEKSSDGGATWTVVASPTSATLNYTGTETGLTLFRVSACNGAGCTVRAADGLWHNEAWQPPAVPANLGVQ